MARHPPTHRANPRSRQVAAIHTAREGAGRNVPWRLALVVALIAAVALVLASKPTRQHATGATAPTSTPAAATDPAVTASATPGPTTTARAATTSAPTTPMGTARATSAAAAMAPTASHVREERPVSLPRLVDLGADRCIPCKAMAPILVELRAEYAGRMQVDFIDVWKDPSAGDPYNIYSIPTQIFFDERGRELTRHQGFISKADILATWRRLGYDFSVPGPATPTS
jgi:thioredoxin 1